MISHDPPPPLCAASTRSFERVRAWLGAEARGRDRPLLVGIGGPGGCGKSTLSRWLIHHLRGVEILSLDDFRLPREVRRRTGRYGSHPEGNDVERLETVLEQVKAGREVRQPVFDPVVGDVTREVNLAPPRIMLADGEIAAHARLRGRLHALVLVEAHWRTQLNTRLTRDLRERHCSLEKAIHLFLESNLRDYPRFAEGAREEAKVVVYRSVRHAFSVRKMPTGF